MVFVLRGVLWCGVVVRGVWSVIVGVVVQMIQSTPCLSRVMPTMHLIKNATKLLQG